MGFCLTPTAPWTQTACTAPHIACLCYRCREEGVRRRHGLCSLLDKGTLQSNAVTKDKSRFLSWDRGTCLWYTAAACTNQWDKSLRVAAAGLLPASRAQTVRFNALGASMLVLNKVSLCCVWMRTTCDSYKPDWSGIWGTAWMIQQAHMFLLSLHQISPQTVLMESACYTQQPACVWRVPLGCTCSYCTSGNVSS